MIKIFFVVLAGVAVFLHQRATTKAGLAVWGSDRWRGIGDRTLPGRLPGRLTPARRPVIRPACDRPDYLSSQQHV